jgi:hypothetical protein
MAQDVITNTDIAAAKVAWLGATSPADEGITYRFYFNLVHGQAQQIADAVRQAAQSQPADAPREID